MLTFAVQTNIGYLREENQDRVDARTYEDRILALVCDGMGGERSGSRQADSPQKCFLSILKNPIRQIWILMPFVPCYCLLYQRRIRLFIQLQK